METESLSITPSHIIEYLYCPRYIYFMYVLSVPQREELYYKAMKGREIHQRKTVVNPEYLRKKIKVISKEVEVYLTGKNLRGIVDEVLFLSDGTASPLDYKFARYNERIYKTYHTQAHCYAKLIMENYKVGVKKAFLVFIRSKNKVVEFDITDKGIAKVDLYINEIGEIIENNRFPRGTSSKSKCLTCTYRNICVR